jgi:hypothetical protein
MDEMVGRDATWRGTWFAAAMAVLLAVLALLSWAGVILDRRDAPQLVLMALGSAALFVIGRVFLRLSERKAR